MTTTYFSMGCSIVGIVKGVAIVDDGPNVSLNKRLGVGLGKD